MFSLDNTCRYWLYNKPVDMRKSFNGLSGIVTNAMSGRLYGGDVFIFVNSSRNACRVCSWSGAEGRFRAIAAGKMPLLAGMLATFAAGVPQKADFVQSRLGRCSFGPECLPRLQLECCRRPISCNRGRENASYGRNACRVCSWSAAEGRFHAIAARKHPAATAHAVCSGVTACRVCSWSGADGQFCAIAAGKHPAATAHAVCSGVTACRVCSWSAPEGRFHAIAASETPPFGPQNASFRPT